MSELMLSAAPPFRTDDPHRDMVRRLTGMGYSGVMIGWSHDWTDEKIAEIRSVYDEAGIRIEEVGAYCNLADADPEKRQENLKNIARSVEVAEKVGCRNIASTVGSPTAPQDLAWDMSRETFSDETWALVRELLSRAAALTEGTNVRFLIEPYLLTCMNSPRAIRRMLDEVGHPNLGVVMDPVNLVTVDNYLHTDELIDECFELWSDCIGLCHAKDIYCDPGRAMVFLEEVKPGEGVLDYQCFVRHITRMRHPVPLMVEHIGEDEALMRARAHIVKQAGEVGVGVV